MTWQVHCGLLPYDELNILTSEPRVLDDLDTSMDELFRAARRVRPGERLLEASGWYSERKAQLEELFQ